MKVGLCDFKTSQEMAPFLYKENASLSVKISVFFRRVVYFIPAGFTWLDSNRVVTLLHDNKLDKEIEPLFQQVDVSKNVRARIQSIASKILNENVEVTVSKIKEYSYGIDLSKEFDSSDHLFLEAIQIAYKGSLTDKDKHLLSSIDLDKIKTFIQNLYLIISENEKLKKHGIDDPRIKKSLLTTDYVEHKVQFILRAKYNHYKALQPYMVPLRGLKDKNVDELAYIQRQFLLEKLSDSQLDDLIRGVSPQVLQSALKSLKVKVLPFIVEELKTVINIEGEGPLKPLIQTLREGKELSDTQVTLLFDLLAIEGDISRLIHSYSHDFDVRVLIHIKSQRKMDLLKSLARHSPDVYLSYKIENKFIEKLIQVICIKGSITESDVGFLDNTSGYVLFNNLRSFDEVIDYLERLKKLGLLKEEDTTYYLTHASEVIKENYSKRLRNYQDNLQNLWPITSEAPKEGLTTDEELLIRVLPRRYLYDNNVFEIVDIWIKEAKNPSQLVQTMESLKNKIREANAIKMKELEDSVQSQLTEKDISVYFPQTDEGKRFKRLLLACVNPSKRDDTTFKDCLIAAKDSDFQNKLLHFKTAANGIKKLQSLGISLRAEDHGNLEKTPVNDLSAKLNEAIIAEHRRLRKGLQDTYKGILDRIPNLTEVEKAFINLPEEEFVNLEITEPLFNIYSSIREKGGQVK